MLLVWESLFRLTNLDSFYLSLTPGVTLSLTHWLFLLVWLVSGTNWHGHMVPNGAVVRKRTRGNSTRAVSRCSNKHQYLSISVPVLHTLALPICLFLSISICLFLLYKIFFWYVCAPLKHPILSNVKSFDFDRQISRSLFSFLLSLICVSYSERVSVGLCLNCIYCYWNWEWLKLKIKNLVVK